MKRFSTLFLESLNRALDGFDIDDPEEIIEIGNSGKNFNQDISRYELLLEDLAWLASNLNSDISQEATKSYIETIEGKKKLGKYYSYAFYIDGETVRSDIDKEYRKYVPQIFATVLTTLEHLIDKEGADVLGFSARMSEPSRVKLYDRLVKKYRKPGYDVITYMEDGLKEYIIIRRKFSDMIGDMQFDLLGIQSKLNEKG